MSECRHPRLAARHAAREAGAPQGEPSRASEPDERFERTFTEANAKAIQHARMPGVGRVRGPVGLPSGTVTFLFTDIEGSTPRWERQPEGMRAAVARHDQLLGAAIDAHAGIVFSTAGDAFCAAFHTPRDAVAAALAAQLSLAAESWPAGADVR